MMSAFSQSVSHIFKGALKAFRTFPAAIGCALAFAIVTAIRIQLDWPQQEPFNFLFNCLHWAFALGALFSMASITAAQSRFNTAAASLSANLLGVAAAAVTFLALYLLSGAEPVGSRYAVITALAAARVVAAMFACLVAFLLLAGYAKERSGFASAFFMAHKAFLIALIYGAVILAGASGVARAVQSLLYHAMSDKVYMYIGTLAGFLTFTVFLGYFPDFRKGAADPHWETAQKQPRFIEVLFGYIMIPIVLALTVVLLIWAGKTVFSGMQVPFERLSAIAASYTVGGLWLHTMVARYASRLAQLYRRVYPLASIVILVFEAWAVVNRLQGSGLKLTEYIFILIWALAAAGAVLLLVKQTRAYPVIAVLAFALTIFSILPEVGYQALPIRAQVSRLEALLISEGMLNNGKLTPAPAEPAQEARAAITDAVDYLAAAGDAKLPAWFDTDFIQSDVFKATFGFEKTWPQPGAIDGEAPGGYLGTYLTLPPGAVDISGYDWAVNPLDSYGKDGDHAAVAGDRGVYQVYWIISDGGVPQIRILLDDQVILEQDLNSYVDAIAEKYPPGQTGSMEAAPEDMSLLLQTPEVEVLLVFSYLDISLDKVNDNMNYYLNLDGLYLKEKP